jgi:hypothetical protein
VERKTVGNWLFEARFGRWSIFHLCTPEAAAYIEKGEPMILYSQSGKTRHAGKKRTKRALTRSQRVLTSRRKISNFNGEPPKCMKCGEEAPKGLIMYALMRKVIT